MSEVHRTTSSSPCNPALLLLLLLLDADVPVPAAAAADGAQQQQQQQPDQYTYNDDPSSGHSYDEFGDRMLDTPGGKSDGDQAAAAGQQQQPSGVDRGWHDFGYDDSYDGDGRWKDDSWDDDVFKQVRLEQDLAEILEYFFKFIK